jgi:hypothetical protein
MADEAPSVKVSLDLDTYTLREKIDLETQLKDNLYTLFPPGEMPTFRGINGLVWLTKRRENPILTFQMFVDANVEDDWEVAKEDPTSAGDSPSTEKISPASSTTGEDSP